jgi:hypothetical protein
LANLAQGQAVGFDERSVEGNDRLLGGRATLFVFVAQAPAGIERLRRRRCSLSPLLLFTRSFFAWCWQSFFLVSTLVFDCIIVAGWGLYS